MERVVGSVGDEGMDVAPNAGTAGDAEVAAVIAGMAEHLIAKHGVHALAIAEAVCTSAEAAGNQEQALVWRRIRHRLAAVLQH